jgi:hypothetical protein
MTKDDARAYREICQEITDSLFMHAATLAGSSVKKGIRYKLACEAIYAACYQGLFGAALKVLQNDGKVPTSFRIQDAWTNRGVHELVSQEVIRKAVDYLGMTDPRYRWAVNILKRGKP